MARTTGTESLRELIADGRLNPNEKLVINRRSATPINGTLDSNGNVIVDGKQYVTPSGAAKAVLNAKSADGWIRWRVPRLSGKTLDEIRRGL